MGWGLDITTEEFDKLRKEIAVEIVNEGIFNKDQEEIEKQIVLYEIYHAVYADDRPTKVDVQKFRLHKMSSQAVDDVHGCIKQQMTAVDLIDKLTSG